MLIDHVKRLGSGLLLSGLTAKTACVIPLLSDSLPASGRIRIPSLDPMKCVVFLIAAFALSSCLYPTTVGGPYRQHVSDADVAQIERLLSHHPPEIEPWQWAPVRRIWFVHSDRAEVTLTDGQAYV